MARTKSSLLSHQPSKYDDEYDDTSSNEEKDDEAVAESDSDDSDSEDSSSNYLLKPVVRSCVSSLKRSGDEEILQDSSSSKKKKADGRRTGDEEILQDSSSSLLKPVVKGSLKRRGDDEILMPVSKKKKAADGGRGNIATGNNNALLKKETPEINVENEGGDFWSKYPNIAASLDNMKLNCPSLPAGVMTTLKEKLSSIGNAKANKLDDKWKQVAVEQLQLDCKMLELMRDQLQVALNK